MAGDWIPIEVSLPSKPEVAVLSVELGKPIDEIVGMLIRFWIWVQTHTADGGLSGMDTAMISAVSHVPERFIGALQNVGWIEVTESGCFIPNFERWLSRGAKRRLMEKRKKARQRATARSCPDDVPQVSRCHRDKCGTTEEERRGEKNILPPNGGSSRSPPAAALSASPSAPPTPSRRSASGSSASVEKAIARIEAAWHAVPDLPSIRRWSASRKKALRARLRDKAWLDQAIEAIGRIAQGKCPFLVGRNDRGWTAGIDWLLRPDSVTRILEGQYDGKRGRSARSERHPADAHRQW